MKRLPTPLLSFTAVTLSAAVSAAAPTSRRLAPLLRALAAAASLLACAPAGRSDQAVAAKPTEDIVTMEKFVSEAAGGDANRIVPNAPTKSVLGLDKTLFETPRSATNISSELLQTLAIRNSEDIARIAPSTYSVFRYGLQGNVSVRNQTSDFYFRGMRRIDPQGNYRTIFAANDSIDIVRGPPSPIYGLGRIGGYLNFNPKTARLEKTGKYLDHVTGDIAYTTGSWDKNIVTVDVGGPMKFGDHQGGYQIFGYYEDSGSYYTNSPHDRHRIVQATATLDLTKAGLRLETGAVAQYSYGGLPGGINRTTQQLVDKGVYWTGSYSYKIDANGDGSMSDNEVLNSYFNGTPQGRGGASTAAGNIGASRNYVGQINAPLNRRLPWQGGPVKGGTITLDQFQAGFLDTAPTQVGGAAYQRQGYQIGVYPTNAAGQPNTDVAKQTFYLPPAFDPAAGTWANVPFDYRKSFGEDYYKAYVYTYFFDLVNDTNPDFTYKNQVLFDSQDQEKTGRNPFSQFQNIVQVEDKITVTKVFHPKWEWLQITALASLNGVYYDGGRRTDNAVDYDWRRSLMTGFTPQDTFFAFTKSNHSGLDGSALSQVQQSNYTSYGLGTLLDVTLFKKLNLLLGGRADAIQSEAYVPAGVFNRNGNGSFTTASANPAFRGYNDFAKSLDNGTSYSLSASYDLTKGLRPYVSYAVQNAIIGDASTAGIPIGNVRRGPLGESFLREFGLKGSYFGGKLFFAGAYYDQSRNSFDPNDGAGSIGATEGKGWELEVRWAVTKQLSLIGSTSIAKTVNILSSGTVSASTRFLGYPDVVDATGKVVIPAEAWGWGGITTTTIPANVHDYDEVPAIPDTIANLTATYAFKNGISIRATGYYQGGFATTRLKEVFVPPAYAFDAGLAYKYHRWDFRLNVINALNRRYFSGGSFNSVAARLPRNFDVTVARSF